MHLAMSSNNSGYYISPDKAKKQQEKLRGQISIKSLQGDVTLAAGADISFARGSNVLHAGFVVLRLPDLKPVARSLASVRVNFPYIPGLLAFREIPALMEAWRQLQLKPDIVIVDGHGIAHPRRMGIATHFGIVADQPTIGCAKNILTGQYNELGETRGSFSQIIDNGKKIGLAYRSRDHVNPIFMSPGHKVDFEDTQEVISKCLTKYKLPETTRQTHQAVNRLRKGEWEEGYWQK